MNHGKIIFLLLALSALLRAQTLEVVTTTPDLADLARRIGGKTVTVESLTRGGEDLHQVNIRPSMLARLREADLLVEMGLDMEHAWLPALLKSARNDRITPGRDGFVNASVAVKARANEDQGKGVHQHPLGNPHFNLDPVAMGRVADLIAERLTALRPADRELYESNRKAFAADLDDHLKSWRDRLAPLEGATFIEYHETWGYFADRFGLKILGRIEPRPGVAPGPRQMASLAGDARKAGTKLVVGRPPHRQDLEKMAELIEGRSLAIDPMSRLDEEGGYLGFMDRVVTEFVDLLKSKASGR